MNKCILGNDLLIKKITQRQVIIRVISFMCYKKFGGRKDGKKEYTGFMHNALIAISPIKKED